VLVGAVFFALAPRIAELALLPVPFIVYGAFWFQRRLARRYARVREASGALNARLNNNLLGIATIKAYTAEGFEAEHIEKASDGYRRANRAAIQFSAAITPIIRMAILAGFTVTLLYGGFLALRGTLGVGSYSVLVYLTQRLLWPMTRLADLSDLYQRSTASIKRVMDLVQTPIAIPYGGAGLPSATVVGELVFEHVSFAYAAQATPTLRDINLRIPAGHSAAFVGGTGGEKSTLVKLLLRFHEPDRGTIRLDGQPLGTLDLEDLRRSIGPGQLPGRRHRGREHRVRRAHRPAGGDRGGRDRRRGPRVRVEPSLRLRHPGRGTWTEAVGRTAAAHRAGRAILKQPPILVLDEATSSVDNETEAAIQRSLDRLVVGRTSLIIAHRLSTVRRADVIYVIDAGQIVEADTHDDLRAAGGPYAALWELQTGERRASRRPAPQRLLSRRGFVSRSRASAGRRSHEAHGKICAVSPGPGS
jgi:ATP-binding cassette subfamily B protein